MTGPDNAKKRAEIDAIIATIAGLQANPALRGMNQPTDREAGDIVRRIEVAALCGGDTK